LQRRLGAHPLFSLPNRQTCAVNIRRRSFQKAFQDRKIGGISWISWLRVYP